MSAPGPVDRFVAVPAGVAGSVLAAVTRVLAHLRPGTWKDIGRLVLDRPYDGPALAFDPVLAPVPGLAPYAWVSALRRQAYRAAREERNGPGGAEATPRPSHPVG